MHRIRVTISFNIYNPFEDFYETSKKVFHIISFEPINVRSTSKSFHDFSVKLVGIDMIGTIRQATTKELYRTT